MAFTPAEFIDSLARFAAKSYRAEEAPSYTSRVEYKLIACHRLRRCRPAVTLAGHDFRL
jgi:hypothetical protein